MWIHNYLAINKPRKTSGSIFAHLYDNLRYQHIVVWSLVAVPHLGRGKIAAISQTTFSNAFS